MICSMTAYAGREIKDQWGNAVWELRSVNHRFLDISVRLPEHFRNLEPIIRERLRMRLARGKIECNLRFSTDANNQNLLRINESLVSQLVQVANWVKLQSNEGEINPLDILRWPGVMLANEQDLDTISVELLKVLDATIDDFVNAREREGAALKSMLELRLKSVRDEVAKVRTQMPEVVKWQRERLISQLEKADIQPENYHLEQELIMMAQRIDVAEELDRLEAHVQETYHILNKNEAVGRRLDFMMQEFNRESNTLASKSINAEVTAASIELKVLIEQMREQIQNVE